MARWDVAIVGAGPAGCTAAVWLSQFGWRVGVIEQASHPCATLMAFDFAQSWVLGSPTTTLASLGRRYAAHALQQPGIEWLLRTPLKTLHRTGNVWQLTAGDQRTATVVILAVGLQPVEGTASSKPGVMNAITLTQRRSQLGEGRVLLLGGGDNALENACYLAKRGHDVTVSTRGAWRGHPRWLTELRCVSGVTLQSQTPPPVIRMREGGQYVVHWGGQSPKVFDHVAELYGFAPRIGPWSSASNVEPEHGAFLCGDASRRWHPCIQTAMADGVQVAQAANRWLANNYPLVANIQ